jgi:hypothetical protein
VRIEGAGVGAMRYCVFSTGTFVEQVTVWEPGSITSRAKSMPTWRRS